VQEGIPETRRALPETGLFLEGVVARAALSPEAFHHALNPQATHPPGGRE